MKNSFFSIWLAFALIFISSGCRKATKDNSITGPSYTKSLIASPANLKLEIDSLTMNRSTQLVYHFSGKPWLFNLNWMNNEIHMYNLEDKSLYKKIKFAVEGPEGVGPLFSFHVHNLDSIFLFQQFSSTFFLTDTSGLIKQQTTHKIPEMHTPAFVHSTYFSALPIVSEGDLIVKTRPEDDYNEITNSDLSKRHLIYKIDLNSGETQLLPHLYPEKYMDDGYKVFDFSLANGQGKWVYSFHSDHNLYSSESETSELTPINAKSRYINTFQNFNVSASRLEHYKYFATAPKYQSILYDKYRNIYYRFCYPEIEADTEEEIMKYRFLPKKFSIMMLDENLHIIGETLFENEKYLSDNVFVAEDGLYISENHPDNPEAEEDYLTFTLLTIADSE